MATKCKRCGRPLTAAASVARGYGRSCAAKVAKLRAIVADYSADQVRRALDLIAADAVTVGRVAGRFMVASASTSGAHVVEAGLRMCSCPAGRRGQACYHLAAVDLLAAA